MDDPVQLAILVVGILVLLFLIWSTINIVRQYERLVIFTLGRVSNGAAGPGLVLLVPIIQQPVKVDLREFYIEVPQQTCITKDNAPISIDFLVYSKVFDPEAFISSMSAPAQNDLPSPSSTTTRQPSSAARTASASISSSLICAEIALRSAGRVRRNRRTGPAAAMATVPHV